MLHGQELLNNINEMIEKYSNLGNWYLVDNYKAKKQILENKGYSQFGTINHIDKTITKETVWITDKAINTFNGMVTNSTGAREFKSNVNYWTGKEADTQTIVLNNEDITITVLETIKTDSLTIEYILSTYKNEDQTSYFKIKTNTGKVFYSDIYYNYFNTKGIKGIKTFKNEFYENIEAHDIYQKYQDKTIKNIFHLL